MFTKKNIENLPFCTCCRYATEGIRAACDWAYKGVSEGSVLEGKWFFFNINHVISTSEPESW